MSRGEGLFCIGVILFLCLASSSSLEADTVELKNGRRMRGRVVKQTAERLVLDVGGGTVTLRMTEVSSVTRDGVLSEASQEPARDTRLPRRDTSLSNRMVDEALRIQGGLAVPSDDGLSFPADDRAQSPEELARLADELLPAVARLRGLAPRSPIAKRVVSQAAIHQIISRILAREHADEPLENAGKALVALGLLPPAVDLQEVFTGFYTQQAAGLYDPSTKILYLADWIPAPLQAGTVAHELVHALQDQHFDLARYVDEVKDDSEATAARHAVAEGEATVIMLEFQLQAAGGSGTELGDLAQWAGSIEEMMAQQDPSLATMPAFLKASALFPYLAGMRFIQAARASYPWSDMGRLYRDPPRSTEQILHPEKYLSQRDDPIPVRVADASAALGPSWKRIDEDAVGEFAVQFLLRQGLDDETADQAADGWGGDRYALYEEAGTRRLALIWCSVWDSVEEARQFVEAYRRVLSSQFPDTASEDEWRTVEERMRVERRGAEVLFVKGPRELDLGRLSQQLWQASVRGSQ